MKSESLFAISTYRFTRYLEFPDYSPDELAEIFRRMAGAEQFSFNEDVADIVRHKMESLTESKTTSFGNARDVRTYYEEVKARQAVRLAKIDHPSRAQMTELLPEDVSVIHGINGGQPPLTQ